MRKVRKNREEEGISEHLMTESIFQRSIPNISQLITSHSWLDLIWGLVFQHVLYSFPKGVAFYSCINQQTAADQIAFVDIAYFTPTQTGEVHCHGFTELGHHVPSHQEAGKLLTEGLRLPPLWQLATTWFSSVALKDGPWSQVLCLTLGLNQSVCVVNM